MKMHWLGVRALITIAGASSVGCTGSDEPGAKGPATSSGASGETSAGSSGSSSGSGGQSDGPSTSTTSSGSTIDLTTGVSTTTGEPGGEFGENGGTVPLSAEQIASIKEGACSGVTARAEPIPPVIELVVDVSQSMDANAPGQPTIGGLSRWDIALPALESALDNLSPDTAVGLQLFPSKQLTIGLAVDDCVGAAGRVDILPLGDVGSSHRLALSEKMTTTPLFLGTPTHNAFYSGVELGLKPYQGPGDRFIVLMTDGAPTTPFDCGATAQTQSGLGPEELQPIVDAVSAAAQAGIRTFVIGSPGSEEGDAGDMRAFLSELAQVGGTGISGCAIEGPNYCHFDMTQSPDFSVALAAGLAEIADQVASTCSFAAPADSDVDLEAVSVIVEHVDGSATLIITDQDGDCATEGWTWNTEGEIELCPQSCELIKMEPGSVVSVSMGCDDLIR